jgi:hypothetical protein
MLHIQKPSTACCARFLQHQALEVQEYASAQKKLQDERRVLREQMRHMEGTITKLQVTAVNSKGRHSTGLVALCCNCSLSG